MSSDLAIALREQSIGSGSSRSTLAVFDERFNPLTGPDARAKRKRRRFAPVDDKQYVPPPFVDVPIGLSVADVDQFFREQRLDDLTSKLSRNDWEMGEPDIRPPSPPPAYDRHGARTNSREIRVRTSMQKEYHKLVAVMLKKLPGYVAPLDFKPPKVILRVEIPQERYSDVNFTGMILGPRGLNHKRLEDESGCQISIRGKGTRIEAQSEEELNMPMHVCIAGDDEAKVAACVKLIEPLVDPLHPGFEAERTRGLEQLALITGTGTAQRDQQLRLLEADGVDELSYTRIEVKCTVCDGRGHFASDCPNRKKEASVEEWRIDSEYSKLISELAGRPVAAAPASSHPLAMKSVPLAPPVRAPVPMRQRPEQIVNKASGPYIPPSGFPPGFVPR